MGTPTRTRRLTVAAIVSFTAFVAAVIPYIRSFSAYDGFQLRHGEEIELDRGCCLYVRDEHPIKHLWGGYLGNNYLDSIWGFAIGNQVEHYPEGNFSIFSIRVPLWPFLFLLLIAPVRWLIARPANTPAFPVVTDTKPRTV